MRSKSVGPNRIQYRNYSVLKNFNNKVNNGVTRCAVCVVVVFKALQGKRKRQWSKKL